MAEITVKFNYSSYYQTGQSCTTGFPSPNSLTDCTGCNILGNQPATRIIPDMRFTCTGTITEWRARGFRSSGDMYPTLGIWRERSSGSETYDRVATIELGTCGSGVEAAGTNSVFECTLPENLRVSVQPGDIAGVRTDSTSNLLFGLFFRSGSDVYVFDPDVSTVTLSQSNSVDQNQPQISLTVEMATTTTAEVSTASTTQPLAATTVATTTMATTSINDDTTVNAMETTTMTEASETTADASTQAMMTSEATVSDEVVSTTRTLAGGLEVTSSATQDTYNSTPVALIVGVVLSCVTVLLILVTLVLITLVLLHFIRKQKKTSQRAEESLRVVHVPQNVNTLNVNKSYVPFQHISTHANAAYDDDTDDDDNVYESIARKATQIGQNIAYISTPLRISDKPAKKTDDDEFYVSDNYDYISPQQDIAQ